MAIKFYVSSYTSPITIPLVALASIGSIYIHADAKANVSYAWIRGASGWEDFTTQCHVLKPSHHLLYTDQILKRRKALSILLGLVRRRIRRKEQRMRLVPDSEVDIVLSYPLIYVIAIGAHVNCLPAPLYPNSLY